MDVTADPSGKIWVATEDKGVFLVDPGTKAFTQFTTKNGLPSNMAYAVEVDKAGRLWVGTLNRGVAVYNGQAWKTYDVGEGPLGERICDIKCNTVNGDVWMASTAGLARYRAKSDSWSYYTQADGLPSEHITALAIDEGGIIYAGTECDGLAVASPQGDYAKWTPMRVPAFAGACSDPNYVNDVLVWERTVYVATPAGLAIGMNNGRNWKLLGTGASGRSDRGPQAGVPRSAILPGLTEDYATCLSRTPDGQLWVGHWRKGCSTVDLKSQEQFLSEPGYEGFVRAVLHTTGETWVCSYGDGLIRLPRKGLAGAKKEAVRQSDKLADVPALPTPCATPSSVELEKLVAALRREPNATGSTISALPDDWRTQGQWLGRYGRYWACLCAFRSPEDYIWGAGESPIEYEAFIGANRSKYDSIRYWVHWLYTAENRSLEMPPTYLDGRILRGMTTPDKNRRQSEWDDHGEAYPMKFDGPHVYCSLKIPEGLFLLSFYDFNKDGHEGFNRFRDYRITIRQRPTSRPASDISGFATWPELAKGRIKDFWGGCHKRYVVRGPLSLTVELNRNHSFNTILASVMVDYLDETPPPYFKDEKAWQEDQKQLVMRMKNLGGGWPAKTVSASGDVVQDLYDQLERLRILNPPAWARWQRIGYTRLLQHLKATLRGEVDDAQELTQRMIATCQYHLQFFHAWEERQKALGLVTAREIEKVVRWDRFSYSNSGKGRANLLRTVTQLREDRALEEHKLKLKAGNLLPARAR